MAERRYIAFYKPYDVLSQFTDRSSGARATLKDYITVPDVYPAGRLDRDSEGLLLLTSDGAWQHRLSDPRYKHPKTYWAQVEGEPSEQDLRQLAEGVTIQGYRTRPAKARRLDPAPDLPPRDPPIRYRKSIPTSWIEITLTEGRNRQVRRMTAAVQLPTLRLIRTAIGNIRLEGLRPGEWRELTAGERDL